MNMARRNFWKIMAGLGLLAAITAWADLRDYAPTSVSVTQTSGALLAADARVKVVMLTNVGDYDVWFCHSGQTAVVNKGFYLPASGSVTLEGENAPKQGLNAIASGGTTTVAIGKG